MLDNCSKVPYNKITKEMIITAIRQRSVPDKPGVLERYHTENIPYLSHGYTTVGSWFFFNNGVHFVTVIYVCLFLERNLLYNVTEKCYVMKPCLVWKRSNKNYVFTPVTFPPQSPFHPSHLSTPVTFLHFLRFLRFLRLLHQLSFITFLY